MTPTRRWDLLSLRADGDLQRRRRRQAPACRVLSGTDLEQPSLKNKEKKTFQTIKEEKDFLRIESRPSLQRWAINSRHSYGRGNAGNARKLHTLFEPGNQTPFYSVRILLS